MSLATRCKDIVMPKHVYDAFVLKCVSVKQCKPGSGRTGERSYATFECPYCTCKIDVPEEDVRNQKAGACKSHLAKCTVYNSSRANNPCKPPSPPVNIPPPKRPKTEDIDIVTIYGLVLVPEDRIVYTGRTKDPDRRLAQHARRSSQCRLVRNAFKKHGRKNFRLEVLMRCRASDAKANESAWIVKNDTLHPNGYNLMHGATAGEESDPSRQLVPAFAGVVPFEGEKEEIQAFAEAWTDVAEVLDDGDTAVVVVRRCLRKPGWAAVPTACPPAGGTKRLVCAPGGLCLCFGRWLKANACMIDRHYAYRMR